MVIKAVARSSTPSKFRYDGARTHMPAEQADGALRIGRQEVVLCGASEALHRQIKEVASTPVPLLILGETGTGKEWLAHAAHHYGGSSERPFKAINCGSIPRSLMEATLFGAERGSYTGAMRTSLGIFEQAKGGTVFLDEIAELQLDAQAALLRILDGQPYLRIGGTEEVVPSVRIVAATNRSLLEMVRAAEFRQDLYYRLCTVLISVPPLRERTDEVAVLASVFLRRANVAFGRDVRGMSEAFLQLLEEYSWPGNIRQLRNVVEGSVVRCRGEVLTPDDAPHELFAKGRNPDASDCHAGFIPDPEAGAYRDQVRDFESSLIMAALRRTSGNKRKAAELLQLPHRTLVHKLHLYGLRDEPCT